jgi:hypothetical protein
LYETAFRFRPGIANVRVGANADGGLYGFDTIPYPPDVADVTG